MAVQSRVFAISLNTDVFDAFPDEIGSADLPGAGLSAGTKRRRLLRPATNWNGMARIISAFLNDTTYEVNGSPEFYVRRLTAAFTANTTWNNQPAHGSDGQARTGVYANHIPGAFAKHAVDITEHIEAWAPATVEKRNGAAGGAEQPFGLKVMLLDETIGGNHNAYWMGITSGDPSKRPSITVTFEDNHSPNAPIVETPNSDGGAAVVVGSYNGKGLIVDFLFSDPDAGDALGNTEVEVYGDAVTDGGATVANRQFYRSGGQGGLVQIPGINHWRWSVALSTLASRVNWRYRLRTMDNSGASNRWGDWSSLADGRIFLAYQGGPPVALSMTTNPEDPHIGATINSLDTGDYITGADVDAYLVKTTGNTPAWNGHVDIGGSAKRVDLPWGGVSLAVGDKVLWRIRLNGRTNVATGDGVVGDYSTFRTTVMQALTGPSTMTPTDVSTKNLSRTAQFTIGNTTNFDGVQYRFYRDDQLIHDSGLVAIVSAATYNFNVPAGVLQFGDGATNTTEWEAAIRTTGSGALGPFSPRHGIRVISLPTTVVTVSA